MPDLPFRPSWSQIRKQAKSLLRACESGDDDALARLAAHLPSSSRDTSASVSLREAQLTVAREYGYESWTDLKKKVEAEAEKDDPAEIRRRRAEQQTSSQDEIDRIVGTATGSGVSECRRMTDGFSCETYRITTRDGQEVVYRANWYNQPDTPHFANEQWGLELLERQGLPGPRCLYIEHDLPGHPRRSVIVNTHVPGASLKSLVERDEISTTDLERLLFDVGALLGQIHQIEVKVFSRVLYPEGFVEDADWQARYGTSIDLDRLRKSAGNTGLSWSLVQEGVDLLMSQTGVDVKPVLLHGDFDLGHVMVESGKVAGLIDYERCTGGDPADEAGIGKDTVNDSWWTPFTSEKEHPIPSKPMHDGYQSIIDVDDAFVARGAWHRFRNQIGGLEYHGVNDVNTAGMMDFLKWRYETDLEAAKSSLT